MAQLVVDAMAVPGNDRMVVYCEKIAHVLEFRDRTVELCAEGSGAPFRCIVAHSGLSSAKNTAEIAKLNSPTERTVFFNCSMLVQGFDVPNLNSVFFVVAKKALTGVLQSVMRPLTAVPGKPISRVFVPVMIPPTASAVATVAGV